MQHDPLTSVPLPIIRSCIDDRLNNVRTLHCPVCKTPIGALKDTVHDFTLVRNTEVGVCLCASYSGEAYAYVHRIVVRRTPMCIV